MAFITKLVKLRAIHGQKLLNKDASNTDSMQSIQKLFYLQLKLTTLIIVQIISTLMAMVINVAVTVDHEEVVSVAADCFIGFICIYCTLPTHDFMFRKACILCIFCCRLCIKRDVIEAEDVQMVEATDGKKDVTDDGQLEVIQKI